MLATTCQFPFLSFPCSSADSRGFASEEQAAAFEKVSQRFTEELRTSGGVSFERPDMQLIGALNCDRAEAERQKDLDEVIDTRYGSMTRREYLSGKHAPRPAADRQMEIFAGPISAEDLEFSQAQCKRDAASIRKYLECRVQLLKAHIEGQAK